jgi:hypothetical protein
MKKLLLIVPILFTVFTLGCKKEPTTPAPQPMPAVNMTRAKSATGARVFIVEPQNGATVSSPVTVKFGIEGIALAPAGEVKDNSGHHHLLIDTDPLPPMDQPLPFSDKILHFGQAQTEAAVNLAPGTHTLQLVLAGGNHIPHDPPVVSEKITISVK